MRTQKHTTLSRRAFLKQIGAGMTALAAANLLSVPADTVHASEAPTGQQWAVLIDLTRCAGCNSCALACQESNNLPETEPHALSSECFSFVEPRQVNGAAGEVDQRYVKRQCMHCLDPACVSACPAAAMYKSESGPVVYRSERCLGCRYCQIACPFGVPSFQWENGVTPVISKCWLCHDKLQAGQKPACVEACPTGALRFGQRQELLAQAHAQIDSNPGRYVDHVFGEFEVGGTAMLYLSDIPFAELGFPVDLPDGAPPEETEKIMNTLPGVIGGVAALMAGTAIYTHRKPGPTARKTDSPTAEVSSLPENRQKE